MQLRYASLLFLATVALAPRAAFGNIAEAPPPALPADEGRLSIDAVHTGAGATPLRAFGTREASSSLAQPVAGHGQGGRFHVVHGFWPDATTALSPRIFRSGFES